MRIEIVSDVICPWCYIGKRRLEAAMAQRPDIQFEIAWRPFQLNPDMPAGGMSRKEYVEAKFGGPERARAIYQRVASEAAGEGLNLNFDGIVRTPNTLAAHSVLRWALGANVQHQLKERIFQLYFIVGADIGDHGVLAQAAADVGMDGAKVRELLDQHADIDVVQEEEQMAREIGVSGVPFFIIERKYGVMGAQPPEALLQAIDRAAAEGLA